MVDKKIRVLIIDDSALVRKILREILSSDEQIEVIGAAADPYIARDKIKKNNPDVLTLDIEMPRMDGITFLRNLMRLHPLPVVMISSLTEKGADLTLQALETGAVDFVSKPKIDVTLGLEEYSEEIIRKVKNAAKVNVRTIQDRKIKIKDVAPKYSADAVLSKNSNKVIFRTTDQIIAIGASTGGTEAIKDVLINLPASAPGIVISQHIPVAFSRSFAIRMNKLSAMNVCEAQDGQQILPGHVYIAPGDHHLIVNRNGAQYICNLNDGPPVNRHKPSVDVMFRSVAQNVGPNAIGVILTGMGDDGAVGLKEMRDSGSHTIAQDKKSSIVWGMPGEAVNKDAVEEIVALEEIAEKLMQRVA